MEQIINTFTSEPIYGIIAVVLAALILYSLVKKIIKAMMFFVLVFGLYLAYVGLTGREIPTNKEQLQDTLIEDVDKAKEKIKEGSSELVDKAKEKITNEMKEGAKEAINEELGGTKKRQKNNYSIYHKRSRPPALTSSWDCATTSSPSKTKTNGFSPL